MKTVEVARARRGITRFCPRCQRYVYADVVRQRNKWRWLCPECGCQLPYDARPKIKPTWGFVNGVPVPQEALVRGLIKLLNRQIKEGKKNQRELKRTKEN